MEKTPRQSQSAVGALLLLCLLPSLALGQITGSGTCPQPATQSGLTSANFDQTWYVYQQYPNTVENGWTCRKATYSGGALTYSAIQSGATAATNFGGSYTYNTYRNGVISVTGLPYQKIFGSDLYGRANQFVVAADPNFGTNADGWAILYSCNNYTEKSFLSFTTRNERFYYILTRSNNPSDATKTAIQNALAGAGVTASALQTFDNSACT